MNILVTGGAGFIGTYLTKSLVRQGYHVRILDNLSKQVHGNSKIFPQDPLTYSECIYGDIRNRNTIENAIKGIDVIVHLAAETGMGQSQYEIFQYFDVNVNGTAILLDVLANSKNSVKKLILASTGRVYGEGPYYCQIHGRQYPEPRGKGAMKNQNWEINCPICTEKLVPVLCKESDTLKPSSMYAVTKWTQEQMIHLFGNLYNIESIVLRYQNVYGAGQALRNPYTGVLSVFCTRLRNGLMLELFEDGLPTRDFVHVEDVAMATVSAITTDGLTGKTINIGSGMMTTIMEVANEMSSTFGSGLQPEITGKFRIGDIRNMAADLSIAKEFLNYYPRVSLKNGIEGLVQWALLQPIEEDLSVKAMSEITEKRLGA